MKWINVQGLQKNKIDHFYILWAKKGWKTTFSKNDFFFAVNFNPLFWLSLISSLKYGKIIYTINIWLYTPEKHIE